MNDSTLTPDRIAQLSPKRLTLLALELQDQLAAERRRDREPIAIVGMACRFPGGADTPERYWELLEQGRDSIREVPADRWNIDAYYDPDADAPGKMSTRFGGFLDRIDAFDADLFGISPREAQTMDPQQRLLLEVCWEALERSGIAPDSLRGTRSGVFVGVCNTDYGQLVFRREHETIDAYCASGAASSVVAGRVAYTLGLEGAAIVIDTACSSSLVAIHEACQYLRSDGISLALAAGVNLIVTPETTIALSKAHMMAPDGRCKTFDDSADGFVRAEGCGVLVLKRLADALADDDDVLAVIRGSAVNQDGRSSGLTVPSGAAQVAVIRAALGAAGLAPADIDYVEAHGTGTSLGDPIEVRALGEALCSERGRPLYVGSVKTNIGHLESAAGIAGVIKTVLAMRHGRIPQHLHLRDPNHDVAWSEIPIEIPVRTTDWPAGERIAGVSSFGFSGTNAHVILAELTTRPDRPCEHEGRPAWHLLPLSAKTPTALAALAERYAARLEEGSDAADVCHTAAVARARLRERAAVLGQDSAALAAALRSARITPKPGARRTGADAEVVFMFAGSGAQSAGMAQGLYSSSRVFRAAIDECAEILRAHVDMPLTEIIHCAQSDEERLLQRTRYAHPALFATEYALAALWRSWGVEPAAVVGHSLGEYVAACVAGVFDLEHALRLVAARARLIDDLPAGGGMLAVAASEATVRELFAALVRPLEIAAVNSPTSVAISGDVEAIEELAAECERRRIEARRLRVSHAFHSRRLEPMLHALEREADAAPARAPQIPFISNLTGALFSPREAPAAAYWAQHARSPVQFAGGVQALAASGYRWFLEVSPHPTLLPLVAQAVTGEDFLLVPSLRRGADDWRQMLEAAGTLYVHGANLDWAALGALHGARRTRAPTYPFERKRFWIDSPFRAGRRVSKGPVLAQPLVRERIVAPLPTFRATFGPSTDSYVFEHKLGGQAMLSAPLFAELAQEAYAALRGTAAARLEELHISTPLVLSAQDATDVYAVVISGDGIDEVRIVTPTGDAEDDWTTHARVRCTARGEAASSPVEPLVLTALGADYVRRDVAETYAALASRGVDLGPRVAGICELWHGPADDAVAVLADPTDGGDRSYAVHPAILDSALQALGTLVSSEPSCGDPFMLAGIDRLTLRRAPASGLVCRARLRAIAATHERVGDLVLYDAAGVPFAELVGVRLQRATGSAAAAKSSWCYEPRWPISEPQPTAFFGAAEQLGDSDATASSAARAFDECAAELGLDEYDRALLAVDGLAHRYILAAFVELGLAASPELSRDIARSRIAPQHHRLFERLCAILVDGGYLEATASGYTWRRREAASSDGPATIVERFPLCRAEVALLEHCGEQLAAVLRGTMDAVGLLFAEGTGESLRMLYRETPFARTTNRVAADVLDALLADVAPGRPIRILEIGAGTGGTTAALLPRVARRRASYVFSDLSQAFLDSARAQLASYPFVSYRIFDVERDPAAQGLMPGAFDVVIAANALHATQDIETAVRHARALLAPGGALLLVEGTTREPWVDLTFGLTDGWWRFSDTAVRADYPLLDRAAWQRLLERLDFTDVQATPTHSSRRGHSQAVIVARAGRASATLRGLRCEEARAWILVGAGRGVAAELEQILEGTVPFRARPSIGWERALAALEAQTDVTTEIVYLAGADEPDATTAARDALELVRAACRAGSTRRRLWIVTQSAAPVTGDPPNLAGTTLWGLGRGYAVEYPDTWGGLIDVDAAVSARERAWNVVEQILDGSAEDQVAFRAGRRHVARLEHAELPPPAARLRPEGYLITGGLGGLGLAAARWLVRQGARRIVLTSRKSLATRAADDPVHAELAAMRKEGADVRVVAADVADRNAMQAVLDELDRDGVALRGVLHCAAAISAAPLDTLDASRLESMLAPKVAGTLVLHELTRTRDLDLFVLFSSTTALLGVRGLAHYAAANQFMDSFAHWRRAQELPALSINWGTWDTMRAASAEERESFVRGGLNPLSSDLALDAMARLAAAGVAQRAVADIDWSKLKSVYEAKRPRPFLERVGESAVAPPRAVHAAGAAPRRLVRDEVLALPSAARYEVLVEHVRGAVNAVLSLAPDRLTDVHEGFFDLGMDSLMAIELKNRLENLFGEHLPATLTFNYPNVDAVARYIERVLAESGVAESPARSSPAATAQPTPASATAFDSPDDVSERALEELLMDKLKGLGFQ